MLLNLKINNFALIKESDIMFTKGLNILSGETGAGKSIIFEALSVALGERASKSMIKTGTDHSVIEAVFSLTDELKSLLSEKGLISDIDEETVIIRRDIYLDYPTVSRINGFSATLADLKEISAYLCDIYGQYEHQLLLDKDNYLSIINKATRIEYNHEYDKLENELKDIFIEIKDLTSSLKNFLEKSSNLDSEIDFLEFQINEINEINPVPGEMDEIKDELKKLQNQELIQETLSNVDNNLRGSDEQFENNDVLAKLGESINNLERISNYMSDVGGLIERMKTSMYELEDISSVISSYIGTDYDESRIEELSLRLSKLQMLEKKYATDIDGVLYKKEKLELELNDLKYLDERIQEVRDKIKLKEDEYNVVANKISNLRKNAAEKLEKNLSDELHELDMQNSVFKVEFSVSKPTEKGIDDVEFLAKTNKGSSFKPIREIISGGEMSRFMLAFKNVLSDANNYKTFVFDEIDAGLSGKVANTVGKRLEKLAEKRQVLIISHLPQIISKADSHYKITKKDIGDETVSSIKKLNENERVEEIARLLSGDTITSETLKNAKLLLDEKR
ncbi:MAG: DNA repair protein RecN [Ezakiella sp.]|uniref:DNA repair protein RecN n=1 Tax=Ezakiella sp. TaxID=1935205 RepID=UPI00297879D3|nr:DNA repair protein RecN [Ezakiella sp.]MDD7730698.1 DNA repair protein RecN [Eubacteriales bacterium]MDY6079420.1 DNA repair protein RecN [Ezakiella sp.]